MPDQFELGLGLICPGLSDFHFNQFVQGPRLFSFALKTDLIGKCRRLLEQQVTGVEQQQAIALFNLLTDFNLNRVDVPIKGGRNLSNVFAPQNEGGLDAIGKFDDDRKKHRAQVSKPTNFARVYSTPSSPETCLQILSLSLTPNQRSRCFSSASRQET